MGTPRALGGTRGQLRAQNHQPDNFPVAQQRIPKEFSSVALKGTQSSQSLETVFAFTGLLLDVCTAQEFPAAMALSLLGPQFWYRR